MISGFENQNDENKFVKLPTKRVSKNLQPYIVGLTFFIGMLLLAKIMKDE
jgi:hypothetical protein